MTTRGHQLQYITLGYNAIEAGVAISAGALASSVSLIGFGLDSVIELTASLAALQLLSKRLDERTAQRAIAASLALLAIGTAWQAITQAGQAERTLTGLIVAIASVIVMPWLAREKRKVARTLNSCALESEARQTDFCFYLSLILLAGMAAQWAFHIPWLDSAAALAMTPLMALEARKAWRGQGCGCH
jgi:divalent metal cation (Fe/Co/Zn/Cd) transporter